jgi:hypothetical protein
VFSGTEEDNAYAQVDNRYLADGMTCCVYVDENVWVRVYAEPTKEERDTGSYTEQGVGLDVVAWHEIVGHGGQFLAKRRAEADVKELKKKGTATDEEIRAAEAKAKAIEWGHPKERWNAQLVGDRSKSDPIIAIENLGRDKLVANKAPRPTWEKPLRHRERHYYKKSTVEESPQ